MTSTSVLWPLVTTLGLLLQFFSKSLIYQFRKIKICYQKCIYSPIFYTWMNQRYIRLHNWLCKNATRGRFKLKINENRTKTMIFSLSRRVQRQYGCQNFRNSSQNSNLLVWCSTIQSRRTKDGKTLQKRRFLWFFDCFCTIFPS